MMVSLKVLFLSLESSFNFLSAVLNILLSFQQAQGNRRGAPPPSIPKKSYTNKRIERKLVGLSEKLTPEELMESGVYQRFNRAVEKIFDNTEDLDVTAEIGEEGKVVAAR